MINNFNLLKKKYPQGYQQFIRNKLSILHHYNESKIFSQDRGAQTEQGNLGESMLRDWLRRLLPKRFGVTQGFIIPPIDADDLHGDLIHFDIIIYDIINAPILWEEFNPEKKDDGLYKAIPIEFVYCILEVKSTFANPNIENAVNQIEKLTIFKKFLPQNFCCGNIFFELPKIYNNANNFNSKKAIESLLPSNELVNLGYLGSLILSCEGKKDEVTGLSFLVKSDDFLKDTGSNLKKNKFQLNTHGVRSSLKQYDDDAHYYSTIFWEEDFFAIWAWNLISIIVGYHNNQEIVNPFNIKYNYCISNKLDLDSLKKDA